MKLPIFPIVLVIVAAVLAGAAFMRSAPNSGEPPQESGYAPAPDAEENAGASRVFEEGTGQAAAEPPAPKPSGYTLAEVAAHNSESSCWTAIEGSVYDLTAWMREHPGGRNAILGLCGKDGTQTFKRQHGGQSRPEEELARFRIGVLM